MVSIMHRMNTKLCRYLRRPATICVRTHLSHCIQSNTKCFLLTCLTEALSADGVYILIVVRGVQPKPTYFPDGKILNALFALLVSYDIEPTTESAVGIALLPLAPFLEIFGNNLCTLPEIALLVAFTGNAFASLADFGNSLCTLLDTDLGREAFVSAGS